MTLSNSIKRRTLGAIVLAALTLAPMFAATPSAQADPPRHAPAFGRRDRDRRDWSRDHYRRPSTYRRPTYTFRRSTVTPRYTAPQRGHWETRYRNGRSYRVYVR